MKQRNCVIVHGGGLVDPSKFVLLKLAEGLDRRKVYDRIYLGRYSFESLYTESFLIPYYRGLDNELRDKRGCWFGTCRGIDLCHPELFSMAVATLKKFNISTVIVAGGDGSARHCAELAPMLAKHGVNVIFAVPLTVDGINGGESLGLTQAVREVVRQTENVVSTSLNTRDNGKFSVVVVETQGRNRDDIMASALKYFHDAGAVADEAMKDLLVLAVPANIPTDLGKLIRKINQSNNQKTLIFVSEGAKINLEHIIQGCDRKVRTLVVGHQVQSNAQTTGSDMVQIWDWLERVCEIIADSPKASVSIVKNGNQVFKTAIKYYAVLNPREGQRADLPEDLTDVLRQYMV